MTRWTPRPKAASPRSTSSRPECRRNTYKVIVDSFDDGMYNGRAYFDSPEIDSGIIFKSNDKLEIGEFVNVKITGCDGYDLIGEKV